MSEILAIFYVKFKVVIYSFIAAYAAATMRYFKQKREGRNPSVTGWFYFGVTSFLVTYSFFATVEYLQVDVPEIPKQIKNFINKEPNFSNNERIHQESNPNTVDSMGCDDSPIHDSNNDSVNSKN
jgi:hypothetical protein